MYPKLTLKNTPKSTHTHPPTSFVKPPQIGIGKTIEIEKAIKETKNKNQLKHKNSNKKNKQLKPQTQIFFIPPQKPSQIRRAKNILMEMMKLQIRCAMMAHKLNVVVEKYLTPDQLEQLQKNFEISFGKLYREMKTKIRENFKHREKRNESTTKLNRISE